MTSYNHSDSETNINTMFNLSEEIEAEGRAWADLTSAASLLEETKTVVRSEIANNIRAARPGMTRRDAELAALVSQEYKDHIQAMIDAKHKANIARVRLEAARAKFEAIRTAEVSRRAEMSKFQSR